MGVRHVVSWKFNGATQEERYAQAAKAVEIIAPLKEIIDEVRSLDIRHNEFFEKTNFDLTLIADFDDVAALRSYLIHPEHEAALRYMAGVIEQRVATDFTV